MKNSIFPCLWFDGNAKEAAQFYCSIFENSEIIDENPTIVFFASYGQKFMCLNGGPHFKINPSISFYIMYESQDELDRAWNKLIEEGSVLMELNKYEWSERYGWLSDKFGVSWQLTLVNAKNNIQKFTPVLMFTGKNNGKTEEAIEYYTSIFDNSEVLGIYRYTKEDQDAEGNIKHAQFTLDGQRFMAMDSSIDHRFGFNEGISFVIYCKNQIEIDYYWEKLSSVPEAEQCGWLKDKYGVSWQIVPDILRELMTDPSRAERVTKAFMPMKKLIIEELINA